nr:sigma-70 family RNA polymerase sigma factor [Tahibacter caeni]
MPRLHRFARSLAGDDGADDLLQSALERALRRWDSRREEGDLQAWLFAIVYRRFVDEYQRAARWQRVRALFGLQQETAAPSAERIHGSRALLAEFRRLPHEQRALLLLISVEGLSYAEAAAALGLPVGTVMSRLSRARERLRRLGEGTTPGTPALRALP